MAEIPCKRSFDGVPKHPSNLTNNIEETNVHKPISSFGYSSLPEVEHYYAGITHSSELTSQRRGYVTSVSNYEESIISNNSPHWTVNEPDVVSKNRICVREITWLLDEESCSSGSYSLSSLKSINLSNENVLPALISPYLENLWNAILHESGDSEFYLAHYHLRENPFICHIVQKLEYFIVSIMQDGIRQEKLKEAVLVLHSIYSLLQNNKLPFSFIDYLKDTLMFNLIDPKSKCNSCSHCYLLKDIIADIIATLFEKYSTEKSLNETNIKLDCTFNYESPFVVHYGSIALSLSNENFMKEFSSSVDGNSKEQICKNAFLEALKNAPSRQSAINVRNKLLIVFKRWLEHWLCSTSSNCSLPKNIKIFIGLDLCITDISYHFCKDELLKYCTLPSKYVCNRMPPKTNKSPFASLSFLLVPSKKEINAMFKKSRNYPPSGTKMSMVHEEFSKEEEVFMSQWSNKVNLKVTSCGVYLHDNNKDDDNSENNDIIMDYPSSSPKTNSGSSSVTNSDNPPVTSFVSSPINNSVNIAPVIFNSVGTSPTVTNSVDSLTAPITDSEDMDCSEQISDVPQQFIEDDPPPKKPSISFEHTSDIFKLSVSVCSRKD